MTQHGSRLALLRSSTFSSRGWLVLLLTALNALLATVSPTQLLTQTTTVTFDNPAPPGSSFDLLQGVFGESTSGPGAGGGRAPVTSISPIISSSIRRPEPRARSRSHGLPGSW